MALRVLVTGASGYVGGRLVPELLDHGHAVRCVVRDPRKLDAAAWRAQVEIVRADLAGDLTDAMAGVDVAVFLVHSIGEGPDWSARERASPRTSDGRRRTPACAASSTSAASATTTRA